MVPILYFAVIALLTLWAAFWVIRLAVRYGMNDALRMNLERGRGGSTRLPW